MFKFVTATVFLATPALALFLAFTVGTIPAVLAAVGVPVLAIGSLVVRLAATREGREAAANLQEHREGLRGSLR
jgi:hypothetical protein